MIGGDPVETGLVKRSNRPGRNVAGVHLIVVSTVGFAFRYSTGFFERSDEQG
jgi:hypothetical protein